MNQIALIKRADTLLEDHQPYHSDLQMDSFIIARSGLTPYGRYKQALREIHGRRQSLHTGYLQQQLTELKIKRLDQEWHEADEIRKEEITYEKELILMGLEESKTALADTERELSRFLEIAEGLKKQIGNLTPERRAELDQEFWMCRLKVMAAVDFITTGHLSGNTIEMIISLPVEMRKGITPLIQRGGQETLINWFLNGEGQKRIEAGQPTSAES